MLSICDCVGGMYRIQEQDEEQRFPAGMWTDKRPEEYTGKEPEKNP